MTHNFYMWHHWVGGTHMGLCRQPQLRLHAVIMNSMVLKLSLEYSSNLIYMYTFELFLAHKKQLKEAIAMY